MSNDKEKYPTIEKLSAVNDEKVALMNFFFFLEDKGLELGLWNQSRLVPANIKNESLIYEYLQIDEKLLEQERQQLLADFKEFSSK